MCVLFLNLQGSTKCFLPQGRAERDCWLGDLLQSLDWHSSTLICLVIVNVDLDSSFPALLFLLIHSYNLFSFVITQSWPSCNSFHLTLTILLEKLELTETLKDTIALQRMCIFLSARWWKTGQIDWYRMALIYSVRINCLWFLRVLPDL